MTQTAHPNEKFQIVPAKLCKGQLPWQLSPRLLELRLLVILFRTKESFRLIVQMEVKWSAGLRGTIGPALVHDLDVAATRTLFLIY